MKIDITDAIMYGLWDEEVNEFPDDSVWLERDSGQFFLTDSLVDEFGYESYDDIAESGYFIPVFRLNESELENDFLFSGYGEEKQAIISISKDKDCSFTVAFRIFAEVNEDFSSKWNEFQKNALAEGVKKWCKETGLEIYSDFDSDRRLKINDGLLMLAEPICKETPHFWFDKKDYSIIDDPTESSIPFPFVDIFKLEKQFVALHSEYKAPKETDFNAKNEDLFYDWCSRNELDDEWDEYNQNQLFSVIIDWCKDNNIPYFIPTNEPIHLGKNI